ncbi:unnamed protein product [Porites evermanni]|uniref:Fibroblast growth factor n=1 Tax=Porites evermanni TaxID=104178 RepID=A0ABN8R9Y0_9CNID|nr:unnamed protein product [Porites evermanni]
MAGSKSSLAFPSLQKYTRKRQLFAKNGFYLAINSTGEVTGTSDGSCLYAVLQFLSVGPDLIAIWGLEAKKYLAVDSEGKIFTTDAERKECVFREFFGKNFYNIFRTCHSDTDGKGWYLSIDEHGKVSAVKVAYSDEPRLHFIVKTVTDCKDADKGNKRTSNTTNNSSHTRQDKKTRKDFGLPSSEVVWIMYPCQLDDGVSDFVSSTPSPPSSSCVSGSSASTGEWTGSGDNASTSV